VEVNSSSENGKCKIHLKLMYDFALANGLVVPLCNLLTKDYLYLYIELSCGVLTFNQSSKRSIIVLSNSDAFDCICKYFVVSLDCF